MSQPPNGKTIQLIEELRPILFIVATLAILAAVTVYACRPAQTPAGRPNHTNTQSHTSCSHRPAQKLQKVQNATIETTPPKNQIQ